SGRTVYVDLNNNRSLDSGEPSRVTVSNGAFRFDGLTPGNYVIRQVLPSGWNSTEALDQFGSRQGYAATAYGGTNVVGADVGSIETTSVGRISGFVYDDAN